MKANFSWRPVCAMAVIILASCSLSELDRFYLAPDGGTCNPDCTGKPCGAPDGCKGVCLIGSCPGGQRCMDGVCNCDGMSCPNGCCEQNQCTSGTENAACGSQGTMCNDCGTAGVCESHTCSACGRVGQSCCAGSCLTGGVCTASACIANNAWAVGWHGTILHWDGTAWTSVNSPVSGTTTTLYGVWGSAPNDVWAVGTGVILHFDGGQWSTALTDPSKEFRSVWGNWIVGNTGCGSNGVVMSPGFNGGWSPLPIGTVAPLNDVTATGPADAWAVGDGGLILHWNGTAWGSVPSGVNVSLSSVSALSPSDAWAVGAGVILHWNGTAWSTEMSLQAMLEKVWTTSVDDVWASSFAGGLLHWNGTSWQSETSGTTVPISGLWAAGTRDVWAVGGFPPISNIIPPSSFSTHSTGTAFGAVGVPTQNALQSIWAFSN